MNKNLRKNKADLDGEQLAETMERLQRLIRAAERAEGLAPLQWEVLRFLGRANRFSRFPMAVADYLAITETLAKKSLSELVEQGLVERMHSRIKTGGNQQYQLTTAGEAFLRGDPLAWIAADAAGIDKAGTTLQVLGQVLSHVISDHPGRPFGTCNDCANYAPSREHGHGCRVFALGLARHELRQICWEYEPED